MPCFTGYWVHEAYDMPVVKLLWIAPQITDAVYK